MENNTTIKGLAVTMQDIRTVLESEQHNDLAFVLDQSPTEMKYYVCTSFTLTVNHLFLLELDEITGEEFNDTEWCMFDSADVDDILFVLDEMQVSNNWCCLCRLPDGKIAALDSCLSQRPGGGAVAYLVPFNNVRR